MVPDVDPWFPTGCQFGLSERVERSRRVLFAVESVGTTREDLSGCQWLAVDVNRDTASHQPLFVLRHIAQYPDDDHRNHQQQNRDQDQIPAVAGGLEICLLRFGSWLVHSGEALIAMDLLMMTDRRSCRTGGIAVCRLLVR